ncbi:MAG: hypothetical protein V1870_05025, partial [Candidatus Aenigmatarchaeota archaeon]
MNIGVVIGQKARYSYNALTTCYNLFAFGRKSGIVNKSCKELVILLTLVLFLLVFSTPVFAETITEAQCSTHCTQSLGYQYGACLTPGQTISQYTNGRQLVSGGDVNIDCIKNGAVGKCNCITTDTTYLSNNNLAMTSVIDSWCKYSVRGGSGEYTLSITYLSVGMNSFTSQDSVSNSVSRIFSGLQEDVKTLSRAQVEAGRTGPDYPIIVTWRPPVSIGNYLFGQQNSNVLS